MQEREPRGILRYIIPQYDEIALFTMSLTCALLLITGFVSSSTNIQLESPREYDPRIIAAGLIFSAGFALSIYHAFSDRPKTYFEKYCMLFFAVLLNAFSGIMAGAYALTTSSGWLIVFPILNILNSVVLFFTYKSGVLNESNISDQHASLSQVALAAAVVLILFGFCYYVFELIWIETLSICLIYVTNLVQVFQSLIMPATIRNRHI
jgi:hypothetical protein